MSDLTVYRDDSEPGISRRMLRGHWAYFAADGTRLTDPAAEALGNTPTIARKSYVHPAPIDLARSGQAGFRDGLALPRSARYLDWYERGLIALLNGAPSPQGEAA